jgi:hypothetical protein
MVNIWVKLLTNIQRLCGSSYLDIRNGTTKTAILGKIQDLDYSLMMGEQLTQKMKDAWGTIVGSVIGLMLCQEEEIKAYPEYDISVVPKNYSTKIWGQTFTGVTNGDEELRKTKINSVLYMVIHMIRNESFNEGESVMEKYLTHAKSFLTNRTKVALKALEDQERLEKESAGHLAASSASAFKAGASAFETPALYGYDPSATSVSGNGDGNGDENLPVDGPLVTVYSPSPQSSIPVQHLVKFCGDNQRKTGRGKKHVNLLTEYFKNALKVATTVAFGHLTSSSQRRAKGVICLGFAKSALALLDTCLSFVSRYDNTPEEWITEVRSDLLMNPAGVLLSLSSEIAQVVDLETSSNTLFGSSIFNSTSSFYATYEELRGTTRDFFTVTVQNTIKQLIMSVDWDEWKPLADTKEQDQFAKSLLLNQVQLQRCVNESLCIHCEYATVGAIADTQEGEDGEPLQCSRRCTVVNEIDEFGEGDQFAEDDEVGEIGGVFQGAAAIVETRLRFVWLGSIKIDVDAVKASLLTAQPLEYSTSEHWSPEWIKSLRADPAMRNIQLDAKYVKFRGRTGNSPDTITHKCHQHREEYYCCTASECTMAHFFSILQHLHRLRSGIFDQCCQYNSLDEYRTDQLGLEQSVIHMVKLEDQAVTIGLLIWHSMRQDARTENTSLTEMLIESMQNYILPIMAGTQNINRKLLRK